MIRRMIARIIGTIAGIIVGCVIGYGFAALINADPHNPWANAGVLLIWAFIILTCSRMVYVEHRKAKRTNYYSDNGE